MKILLSGFEPFGGSVVNPSEQVVKRLAKTNFERIKLFPVILPVDSRKGPEMLIAALDKVEPDVVVSLGEAARRSSISIERVAVNLMDYRIPDNNGNTITNKQIAEDGPAAYFSTLPVREIYDRILKKSIPIDLSLSAGAYLCNQIMYLVLHRIAIENRPIKAGFIHLPALPEQAVLANPPMASMSLETSLKGIITALETIRDIDRI